MLKLKKIIINPKIYKWVLNKGKPIHTDKQIDYRYTLGLDSTDKKSKLR